MNGPSQHLTWKELACKDGTPYPQEWRTTRAIQIAGIFELIREQWNKPITVLSAYRTPTWNKKVGGAKNSQHVQGRALDLYPPKGISLDEFYKVIKTLAEMSTIRGIGKYKTFVHVDVRPTEDIAFWRGNGVEDTAINT